MLCCRLYLFKGEAQDMQQMEAAGSVPTKLRPDDSSVSAACDRGEQDLVRATLGDQQSGQTRVHHRYRQVVYFNCVMTSTQIRPREAK